MEDEVIDSTVEDVAPEVVEESPKSMDDTIRETLAAIEARGEETPEETTEQKAERIRDEKGRFAQKTAAQDQPTEESAPPLAESIPTDPVSAPVVPPELQRLGLRKEEADEIAKNPVAMQAIIRRSEEMHKGLEQYRTKAQFGDQMAQAVQPFAQTIQSLGVHPAQAVQKLFSADHTLRYGTPEQKQAAFVNLAQSYGIDLGGVQQYQANQPYVDPRVSALEQQIQQQNAWIQQKEQQREWQERQTLNSDIEAFKSNPANKHFEAVRNDMAGLIQAGLATTLQDAYERAIYANPQVRATVLAEQQAKAEADRKAAQVQRAQEAKKAAAVNISRRGTMPAKAPLGSMEDTIRAQAERLGML
jgi:hypothetical protein